jgi:hypothetical protein
MTKRDYQAIARIIHETLAPQCEVCETPFRTLSGPSYGCPVHGLRAAKVRSVGAVAEGFKARLADVMQADNPAFDRARFLAACETGGSK